MRLPQTEVGADGHESFGIEIAPGSPYTGIFGTGTAYDTTEFTLPPGSNAYLNAPWFRAPGGCIAAGSLYRNASHTAPMAGTTYSYENEFMVINSCSNTVLFESSIDATFESAYVGLDGNNPQYEIGIFTRDVHPSASSTWNVWLYNYAMARWDTIVSSTGTNASDAGLAAFVALFDQDVCPAIEPMYANDLALFDPSTSRFVPIAQATGASSAFVAPPSSGSCFQDDGSHTQFFATTHNTGYWTVTAHYSRPGLTRYAVGAASVPVAAMTAGPDGNLWLIDAGVVKLTTSGTTTRYGGSAYGNIVSGPEGRLWFPSVSSITNVTTAGVEQSHPLPNGVAAGAVADGADGNVWFTDELGDAIGRMTPSGVVTMFGLPRNTEPMDIVAGPDGNLWFADYNGESVGRITTSGVITLFPTSGHLLRIASGPSSSLWFTTFEGQVGQCTTAGAISLSWPPGYKATGPIAAVGSAVWYAARAAVSSNGSAGSASAPYLVGTLGGALYVVPDNPTSMTAGPDGKLWIGFGSIGAVARFDSP